MYKGLLAAGAALVLAVVPGSAQAQADCDRACLAGKLDTFLDAVVAHDPSKAGLWVGFRQTENALLRAPGEGIWASNTGIGKVDARFYDAETGQAEFYGTIEEGEATAVASVRLKVEEGEITEAEWHIAREGDPGITGVGSRNTFDVANLEAHPLTARVVPVAQRHSRRDLVAAVNSYFDGIVAATGRHVQGVDGCRRYENGAGGESWNTREPYPEDLDFQSGVDCRSGYASLGIVNVAARRYLMVDEEAQVVVASAVFLREPLNPKRRNCFMEIFVMKDGKIDAVYAAMTYADSNVPLPNWAPYDGNYPIPLDLMMHN